MRHPRFSVPQWVENLLLGHLTKNQYRVWLLTLFFLILLVPGVDYTVGRSSIHLNLYPLPIMLSIFLFGPVGLISILILLVIYHLVQMSLGLEAHAVLVNNLAQLSLTLVIGLLCSWLMEAYRALYEGKADQARVRHELLMNLTHELRSPLFAIRGIVRNLSRNISRLSESEVQVCLNEAQAAIAAINRDVEGLSQVFRADLKALEARVEEVGVSKIVQEVLNRYPPEFHPNHQFEVEIEGEPRVLCDPLLTQQILDNLISNALRHTEKGLIRVAIKELPKEVKISVSDQGPGVPEEDRDRIFRRYDRGSRLSGLGFGVGLYLVDMYCSMQGGRVVLENSPQGACFAFYLKKGSAE